MPIEGQPIPLAPIGHWFSFIGTGKKINIAGAAHQFYILQKIICHIFCPQRIAGHQYDRGNFSGFGADMNTHLIISVEMKVFILSENNDFCKARCTQRQHEEHRSLLSVFAPLRETKNMTMSTSNTNQRTTPSNTKPQPATNSPAKAGYRKPPCACCSTISIPKWPNVPMILSYMVAEEKQPEILKRSIISLLH